MYLHHELASSSYILGLVVAKKILDGEDRKCMLGHSMNIHIGFEMHSSELLRVAICEVPSGGCLESNFQLYCHMNLIVIARPF